MYSSNAFWTLQPNTPSMVATMAPDPVPPTKAKYSEGKKGWWTDNPWRLRIFLPIERRMCNIGRQRVPPCPSNESTATGLAELCISLGCDIATRKPCVRYAPRIASGDG
jgi:hypothetical protein